MNFINSIKTTAIIATTMFFHSCNSNTNEGTCESPIDPSPSKYSFSAGGGTLEIVTKVDFWWFDISHDYYPQDETSKIEVIREQPDNDVSNIIEIKSEWFSIKRSKERGLTVIIEPNSSGEKRWYTLNLQYANCFETVYLSQEN
ncbi:MAG: hypothetical protein ACRC6R_00390 [Bacteroidales bacterium]